MRQIWHIYNQRIKMNRLMYDKLTFEDTWIFRFCALCSNFQLVVFTLKIDEIQ